MGPKCLSQAGSAPRSIVQVQTRQRAGQLSACTRASFCGFAPVLCGDTLVIAPARVCRQSVPAIEVHHVGIEQETLERVQEILGHTFRDTDLIDVALTHASIADSRVISNERLEFLGDAVLGMLVCEHLYNRYPDLLEGDLTKIKSVAVSRQMCAKLATHLELDDLLLLGKGMKSRSALPSSLAAAVLESVIGAVFLDGGIDKARDFLMPLLAPHIEQAAESGHQQNFKSVLQQHAQREFGESPIYVLSDEKGPDHAKAFAVSVELCGERYEACWAPSKKQAEQHAALIALETLDLIQRDELGHILYMPHGNGSANGDGIFLVEDTDEEAD